MAPFRRVSHHGSKFFNDADLKPGAESVLESSYGTIPERTKSSAGLEKLIDLEAHPACHGMVQCFEVIGVLMLFASAWLASDSVTKGCGMALFELGVLFIDLPEGLELHYKQLVGAVWWLAFAFATAAVIFQFVWILAFGDSGIVALGGIAGTVGLMTVMTANNVAHKWKLTLADTVVWIGTILLWIFALVYEALDYMQDEHIIKKSIWTELCLAGCGLAIVIVISGELIESMMSDPKEWGWEEEDAEEEKA